ncbi:MAG: hypothetical protein EpisKO_06140 [Epibacterium sp.]
MTTKGHNTPATPTAETYGALETAYNFFNERLFDGRLMPCLFVLQRGKSSRRGHFHAEIWQNAETPIHTADEMSINPNTMQSRSLTDILSTLVHEMCHLEQHHFGEPSRNGYHNKEWGAMMDAVGLIPSNTGEPGGKRTGQQMTHYIEPNGRFEIACAELIESGFLIPWLSLDTTPEPKERKKPTRAKFTCIGCASNAWGKPELHIHCADCKLPMIPSTVTTDQAAEMLKGYLKSSEIERALGVSISPETADPNQIDIEDYIKGAA